jgi:two-component system, NarL family, response regulator
MSNDKRIRVMIVEDHFMVRAGLTAIINSQSDMFTVAEGTNGQEALELFDKFRPDVTLMDLLLPGLDGVQAMGEIRKKHPQARMIVISAHGGD